MSSGTVAGQTLLATTSGNVTGIVAVANGGTGVNASTTAANLVFASPNGASGAPTFRALVASDLPAGSSTPAILSGTCSGTATSGASLGVFGLGEISALTCTVTTTAATHRGMLMPSAGTLKNLRVLVGTTGVNPNSGAFTVVVNNTSTALTCTVGSSGTTCNDTTHTAAVNAGDEVTVFFTTKNIGETLADVRVSLEKQ